jgi:CheY-like chemotaxis protein
VLIDADPAVPLLRVDKSQLETVLVNLAINARDAMPTGGTLTLATTAETVRAAGTHAAGLSPGQYIRLSVSDTGVGMDAATLARAAEPFFTTKEVGRGTGLGLAMARGFAEQSGGGFAIESREGQGTTVTLWLPRTPEVVAAPARARDGRTAATPARVLLVDDDILVRQALAGQLRDEGYDVIEASDGLAALAWFDKGGKADLLVTDFAMPGMNGLALINEARGRWRSLPVLLLTGYADDSVQRTIDTAVGATTVLMRKPVRGIELAERAASLLACATGERT